MAAKYKPTKKYVCPSDWDAENGGWETAVFCYPDSPEWRRLITGHIHWLTSGWAYKEGTGDFNQTTEITYQIFESLCMACGDDFKRIADALWIDVGGEEKSITQVLHDDSQRDAVQITDLIDGIEALEPALYEQFTDFYEFINVIKDIIPDIKFPSLVEMMKTLLEIRYKRETLAQAKMLTLNSRYIGYALAPRTTTPEEEETEINSRFKEFLKSPWLLTAIAVLDPSPSGEIALAARFAGVLRNAWSFVDGLMARILAGNVTDPGTPADNVVEAINRLGMGFRGLNVNVSDCDDCGPETGGSPSFGTPEPDYQCEAGKWYIGVIIDRLWTLINLQYVEDAPSDIFDTAEQWTTGAISDIADWLSSRSIAIFTGEQINLNEDEADYPITDPSTSFINDWGREFSLSQNDINALYELLTNGITRVETGQIYNPVRDAYIDVPIDVVYHLNAMEYLTNIIDHQQDILDALTTAETASEARQSIVAVFEADISPAFLDGGVEYKPARRKLTDLITGQGVVNRIFSTDVSQTEMDLVSWRVLAECPDDDLNLSCLQSLLQAYGTPLVGDGGSPIQWDTATYPVGTWITITSEFQNDGFPAGQNYEVVSFQDFDSDYSMEAEILSIPEGFSLDVYIADCDGETYSQNHNSPGSLGTFKAHIFALATAPKQASSPGSFQIRLRRLT